MAIHLVDFKRVIFHLWKKPLQVSRNEDYMIDIYFKGRVLTSVLPNVLYPSEKASAIIKKSAFLEPVDAIKNEVLSY